MLNDHEETIKIYDKIAKIYEDKFMYLDLYNDTYAFLCEELALPNAKILELGCGPGNITKYLLTRRPDFQIEAIDLAPNMIKLAKENNPSAQFHIMDCRNIHTLTTKFNAIISGFTLPYLSKDECEKLILDCSNLLEHQGIVYLSCIEGNYENSGYEYSSNGQEKMYIYYHQEDYIQQMLKENNFDLIQVFRKPYPGKNGQSATHLILIAVKK